MELALAFGDCIRIAVAIVERNRRCSVTDDVHTEVIH